MPVARDMITVKKSSDVVQTFRSARHGRPEGLHYDSPGRQAACLTAIFLPALQPSVIAVRLKSHTTYEIATTKKYADIQAEFTSRMATFYVVRFRARELLTRSQIRQILGW